MITIDDNHALKSAETAEADLKRAMDAAFKLLHDSGQKNVEAPKE